MHLTFRGSGCGLDRFVVAVSTLNVQRKRLGGSTDNSPRHADQCPSQKPGDGVDERDERHHNADIYQALAYANATQLPNTTLIYAHTEQPTATHTTIDGTTIHIEALNLDGTPQQILDEIETLATQLENRNLTQRIAS